MNNKGIVQLQRVLTEVEAYVLLAMVNNSRSELYIQCCVLALIDGCLVSSLGELVRSEVYYAP